MINNQLELRRKLAELQRQLKELEAFEVVITQRRIEADIWDDLRENEGAKLVMEQHDIWFIRIVEIKKEIIEIKKTIYKLKQK